MVYRWNIADFGGFSLAGISLDYCKWTFLGFIAAVSPILVVIVLHIADRQKSVPNNGIANCDDTIYLHLSILHKLVNRVDQFLYHEQAHSNILHPIRQSLGNAETDITGKMSKKTNTGKLKNESQRKNISQNLSLSPDARWQRHYISFMTRLTGNTLCVKGE